MVIQTLLCHIAEQDMHFLSARQLADKTALVLDIQDCFSLMLSQVDGLNIEPWEITGAAVWFGVG